MVPFHSAPQAVELVALISLAIVGLSHIVQPGVWVRYFSTLAEQGSNGVVTSVATLQFMPAVVIVAFHQVWTGPGIVLTLFGWALLAKCTAALVFPGFGESGLALARRKENTGFIAAGVMLLFVAGASGWALLL